MNSPHSRRHHPHSTETARTLALAALLGLGGCTSGTPGGPSALPMTGAYTLVITASSVCHLPVSVFQWDLEATTTGGTKSAKVRATLPGGDATVDVNLTQSLVSKTTTTQVAGSTSTHLAPFGAEPLRVTISSSVIGTSTSSSDGRGEVLDGILDGSINLSNAGDKANNSKGSCTAADHRWTLKAR
jgi:hypothetical protein